MKTEIPWQRIVSYHKEITVRAEEAFFSLSVSESNSERWSSLKGFSPENLAGPWELNSSDLVSKAVFRNIQNGEVQELYIGGPCYFRWKKNFAKGFELFWQPVLYRDVRAVLEESGLLILLPDQGNWEVSPLVYSLLESKNVCPEQPLEELMNEILEKAHKSASTSGEDLTKTLIHFIQKNIPELGELVSAEFPDRNGHKRPSDWIVFTPAEASALTRNLVSDYNRLEETLKLDPSAIGGLSLLTPGRAIDYDNDNVTALPIVPLNNSQQTAVEGILRKKPVTVISGPPGCGKSQVLSVLLNSWANGDSVLFASNNNQAVDVVRDRLSPFEDVFPISVRAGARNHSNVQDVIRRVINAVSYGTKGIDSNGSSENESRELLRKKNVLESHLESKLPQIISQSVNSAINAYGEYAKAYNSLESKQNQLVLDLKAIGYDTRPERFTTDILLPLQEWLSNLSYVKTQIFESQLKYKRYSDEFERLVGKREDLLSSVGGKSAGIEKWDWLTIRTPLIQQKGWYDRFRILMESPVEEKLRPFKWHVDYEFWKDSKDATFWVDRASALYSQINTTLTQWQHSLQEIEQMRFELESARNSIDLLGIPAHQEISKDLVEEWLKVYSLMITIPSGRFEWAPFSEKSRSMREIKKIENGLRRQVPLNIWREIGTMDEDGRIKLCTVIEAVHRFQLIKEKWEASDSLRTEINERFNQLKVGMNELRITPIPSDWNTSRWQDAGAALIARIEVGKEAEQAHLKRNAFVECKEEIQSICREFQTMGTGIPVREFWLKNSGSVWKNTVDKIVSDFEPADTGILKKILYEGSMDVFFSAWGELSSVQKDIDESVRAISLIPTENQLVTEWWSACPGVSLKITNEKILPNEEHELFAHAEACSKWSQKWQQFTDNDSPEFRKLIDSERRRALNALSSVSEKLPDGEMRNSFMALISPVISGTVTEWPLAEMSRSVESFSPERIKAQIQAIDAKLEAVTFDSSRFDRIQSLSRNTKVQNALEKLSGHFARGNGSLGQTGYQDFKDALIALPIWITTALSAQAIPMVPELFDLLVIDEATQCSLTNLLPLIYRAKRIAVIGDPEQLPAIDTISASAEVALSTKMDIFEWISDYGHANNDVYKSVVRTLPHRHGDVFSLIEHYRSHPLIIGFSNQFVYQQRLLLRKNPDQIKAIPFGNGVHGLNVKGACQRGDRNSSWRNVPEAEEVCRIIKELKASENYSNFTIGVVSPFRAQTDLISEMIEGQGISRGVTVGTVHKYQGDERDIIIFSPVVSRGMTDSAARWVESPRNLINVAVTRAREGLFVIGDLDACRKQPGILGELTRYVETVSDLRKTSLFELDLFSWMVVSGWNPEVHVHINDIEVDFVLKNGSKGIKLAIEVDGSQHEKSKSQDSARDAFLISKGYQVLRFSARDVKETPARVIKDIEMAYLGVAE